MSINGFASARQKTVQVASSLQDVSTLIGKRQNNPVKLETGSTIEAGLDLETEARILQKQAKDIQQGIFNLLVLGEFKTGKSTLINALLGTKALPASTPPTTAIISVLVYGQSQKVAIYEIGKEDPRLIDWEEFRKEYTLSFQDAETIQQTGHLNRFENISYAQLECQHQICANGVKIIDSPGLKENKIRTKLTKDWLKQSQAIIFVLNATRVISEDEKKLISNFCKNRERVNNVFFVINRINQINKNDIDLIKNWVKNSLDNYFLDEKGQFDENFYNRRVFFVNAQAALEARTQNPTNTSMFEESGVLALEQELEGFLTSDEKLITAFYTNLQVLQGIVEKACKDIFLKKAAQNLGLDELENNQSKVKTRFRGLEARRNSIEKAINLYGENLSSKILINWQDYTNDLLKQDKDLQKSLNFDEVSLQRIILSIINKESQEEIRNLVQREVEGYLSEKFTKWVEQLPTVIEEDIENMKGMIEEEIVNFQLELIQLKSFFSGVGITDEQLDVEKVNAIKVTQLFVGVATGDLSSIFGALVGPGHWESLFAQILFQTFAIGAAYVANLLWSGPVGIAAIIAIEVIQVILGLHLTKDNFQKSLRETIGKKLREELPQRLINKKEDIRQLIVSQFHQLAQSTTKILQQQLDDLRTEQEDIIRRKQDDSFSAEEEKLRLDAISNKLLDIYDRVKLDIFGKGTTPQENNKFRNLLDRGAI
ncbi:MULTISPECIES: dynamin family protein [Nostoc]|uniref:Dynamin family protein n=2 Tax=Nostoc TaxID=1177 RepID=A0ABR8IGX9_9NOSO|nr:MULTISPECIES: dynamin family protein [Nostoc]MBD2564737.1 dynamin family protein [Nostoc linckia FACHB-391]MBD2650859.1 dynamin family protein [Nostoc foliaceum FACHB-393]